MKVLKKGSGWKKQITCRGCKAVLEIEGSDIKYEVTDEDANMQQHELDIEGRYFIECPECEQQNILKAKDIPKNIRESLKE